MGRILSLALCASFLVSCARERHLEVPDVRKQIKGTEQVESSGFKPVGKPQTPDEEKTAYDLTLARTALNQVYLLQTQIIAQEQIPQLNGGRSRLVYFVQKGNQIVMKESSEGQVVSQDLPQNLILATFPVKSSTANDVTFDWNEGLTRLFVSSDWKAQDGEGPDVKSDFEIIPVAYSYLESVDYVDNFAVLRQIVQADVAGMSGESLVPVEAKFFLTPYVRNTDFKPTLSEDQAMRTFGFFESAPRYDEKGGTVIHASKFDLKNKPIVYAVSANTPADYKEAVKRGVLYWNSVYPGIVSVVDAPAGVTAPDLKFNVVQWVNWDAAGFAYADAMMDPMTGENKHAQVFMTSVFAVSSRARALRLLARLNSPKPTRSLGFKNLTSEPLCVLDDTAKLAKGLRAILDSGADDATVHRLSEDYVTEVVAHEIGHTLGLRHNFTGNLGASFALKDRGEVYKKYMLSDDVDAKLETSSSVMEYQLFEESSLTGAKMRKLHAPLRYDKMALDALYNGTKYARKDVPAFCTDSGAKIYADCVRFDAGNSFVEYAQWNQQDSLDALPNSILEIYLKASKAVLVSGSEVPVEDVKVTTDALVEAIGLPKGAVLSSLGSGVPLWAVRRTFPVVTSLNEDAVKKAEHEYVGKEVARLGGLAAVVPALPADFVAVQSARFIRLLDSGVYSKGLKPDGTTWEFSADELNVIRETGLAYIKDLNKKLIKQDVKLLGAIDEIPEDANLSETVALLKARAELYVLSQDAQTTQTLTVKNKEGKDVEVHLAKFVYEQEVRKAAASLLKESRFEGFAVAEDERDGLKQAFLDLVEKAVGKQDQYETDKLPKEMRKWLQEAKEIEMAL